MRIISGRFKGRRLAALGKGDPVAHLRPTSDRVRESLFSMLSGGRFGDPIDQASVLDLFAGTGALGLEALSRGASSVTFVENGRKSLGLLRQNIELCEAASETKVLQKDATRLGENTGEAFDLVFLDPPYGKEMGEQAISSALAGGWLAKDAVIVWEESRPPVAVEGFALLDQRTYGDTTITILELA